MLDQNTAPAFTVSAADLTAGCAFLARIIERRSSNPILANVAFPGDGTMRATDLDMEGTWTLESVEPHTPFTIPLATLQKILRGAGKGKLAHFTPSSDADAPVSIELDGLASSIPSLPFADFPQLTRSETPLAIPMPAGELFGALAFTMPTMSTEEARYYLNGVFLHSRRDRMALVATDGHRLALRPTEHAWPEDAAPGVILPAKACKIVRDTIGKKGDGQAMLHVGGSRVTVSAGNWTLHTKVVDGTFPDYTRVIPSASAACNLSASVSELQKITKRLTGLSSDGARALKFTVSQDVQSLSQDTPNAASHVMRFKGTDIAQDGVVGVNGTYLQSMLDAFDGMGADTIRMDLEPGNPSKFTAPGTDSLWVIMSMRA